MRILFLSHTDTSGPFRVGSHHLSRALSLLGHDVAHVATPVSLVHRVLRRVPDSKLERAKARPVRDENGVLHITPLTLAPAGLWPLDIRSVLGSWMTPGRVEICFIDQPLLWSREVRQLSRTLVYRPTDLYLGGLKARMQREILAQADGVVSTSLEVERHLPVTAQPHLVLPNGVDFDELFASGPARRSPRAVYVGALDERFGWRELEALARSAESIPFDVYGPLPARVPLLPRNVVLRGPIEYARLGVELAQATIGLLPLSGAPENAGRSPMKLYEYLASGLTVVATSTPSIRANRDIGIFTFQNEYDAPSAFSAAMAVATPNQSGIAAARRNSWSEKSRLLLSFACGLPAGGGW